MAEQEAIEALRGALEELLEWARPMPGYYQSKAVSKAQNALNARCCRLHGSHGQHESRCYLAALSRPADREQRFRVWVEGPRGQRFVGQSDDFSEAVALAEGSYGQIWDGLEKAWVAPDNEELLEPSRPDPSHGVVPEAERLKAEHKIAFRALTRINAGGSAKWSKEQARQALNEIYELRTIASSKETAGG